MAERIRLGELLVDTGLITRAQLDEALGRQREDKRRLGELLVAAGAITEAKVTQVLSQQLSIPWVSLSHIDFSRALLDLVPTETAQKYGVVPIYVRRGKNRTQTLYVAMQDPTEGDALEEIATFSGLPVRAMIAPPSDIRGAIRAYYLGLPPEDGPQVQPLSARGETMTRTGDSVPASDPTLDLTSEPPSGPSSAGAHDAGLPLEHLPPPPSTAELGADAAPDSEPVESRDARMPRPKQARARQKMVTLTLLDGTQITLPASPKAEKGASVPAPAGLTTRDLIEALRAHAGGADVSEVLGEGVNWQGMFAALLSLLLKKNLITDWEFVRELKR